MNILAYHSDPELWEHILPIVNALDFYDRPHSYHVVFANNVTGDDVLSWDAAVAIP